MSTIAPAGTHTVSGLNITRWGTGSPVLLVHGSGHGDPGGGAKKWKFQEPLAGKGYELIVPDRPGQGQSPSQGPDNYELDWPWVTDLLDPGAHLIAHSYGGAIALHAAGVRPDLVKSLTLIEAPIFSAAADRPEAVQKAAEIRAAMDTKLPPLAAIRAFKVLGIPRDRSLQERPPISGMRNMAKGFKSMRPPDEFDFGPSIKAISDARIPLLYVDGGWSPAFRAIGEELAQQTGGEAVTIRAGHHFPHMIGGGAEFNDLWLTFVATHGGGA